MTSLARGLVAAFAALWLASAAAQQAYPTKTIRFIVTFPPGGSSDLIARAIAPVLSDRLRQSVIVENRPGAGGNIGMEMLAKSAPDGYTMGLGAAGALAANVSLYPKLPYDPRKDFAPVSNVAFVPFFIIAHPSLPVNNLEELIALARAKPGELLLGYGGNGTAMHLSGELFKLMAGVEMQHVPYRGSAPMLTDLLAGQVQVAFDNLQPSIPHIKEGKLRALAVTTSTRSDALPELPTIADFVPGYEASTWNGVCAPKGTPAEIVQKLNQEINAALADEKFKGRLAEMGAWAIAGSPADASKLIDDEVEKWGKVIRTGNIKAQ